MVASRITGGSARMVCSAGTTGGDVGSGGCGGGGDVSLFFYNQSCHLCSGGVGVCRDLFFYTQSCRLWSLWTFRRRRGGGLRVGSGTRR